MKFFNSLKTMSSFPILISEQLLLSECVTQIEPRMQHKRLIVSQSHRKIYEPAQFSTFSDHISFSSPFFWGTGSKQSTHVITILNSHIVSFALLCFGQWSLLCTSMWHFQTKIPISIVIIVCLSQTMYNL